MKTIINSRYSLIIKNYRVICVDREGNTKVYENVDCLKVEKNGFYRLYFSKGIPTEKENYFIKAVVLNADFYRLIEWELMLESKKYNKPFIRALFFAGIGVIGIIIEIIISINRFM